MKKLLSVIIVVLMVTILLCPAVYADEIQAGVSGPSAIRAGDTVTLSVSLTGTGLVNSLATVSYDPDLLTFKSISTVASGWEFDNSQPTDVESGDGLTKSVRIIGETDNKPVNSKTEMLKISFTLSKSAETGASVKINFAIDASDGETDYSTTASYTKAVSAPYSTDSTLKSLSIEGYEFNEEFSPSRTSYTVKGEVEYTTSKITVNAKTNDSGAKTEISGTRLSVGANTVYVKVTAEDGSTSTTYKITLTMKQDPNYVKSSDSSLGALNVSQGLLSPRFSSDVTNYAVYLPYEEERVTISGEPNSVKASCDDITSALHVGENLLVIVCTAEDGSTTEYTVTVYRMEKFGTEQETGEGDDTQETADTDQTEDTGYVTSSPESTETADSTEAVSNDGDATTAEPSGSSSDTEDITDDQTDSGIHRPIPLWIVVVIAIACLILGSLGTFIVFKLK